jgi:DNA polymerase-1
MGFVVLASEELEADDLIGAASIQLSGHQSVIHSRDKDLRQLLSSHVEMKDIMTEKVWSEASLSSEVGLIPEQVPLYLALMGDSSDNIVGLPGIGDKTARALLAQYKNWSQILLAAKSGAKLPVRGSDRISHTLIEYETLVEHNLKLTKLRIDGKLDLSVKPFDQSGYDMVIALAEQFGIRTKLKKALMDISELVK